MMQNAYICLGSNLGDRSANLLRAVGDIINHKLRLTATSSIYETEPVDNTDQPPFLNMVARVSGEGLEPYSVMRIFLDIEHHLGRVRTTGKGARIIDIDLLLLDDLIIDGCENGVDLVLPHPRLHERRFVLTPLAEIAPDLVHPVMRKTVMALLDGLEDSASVIAYRS